MLPIYCKIRDIKSKVPGKKRKCFRILIFFAVSLLVAYVLDMVSHYIVAALIVYPTDVAQSSDFSIVRFLIIFLLVLYITLHGLIKLHLIYDFIFKNRYIIGSTLFVVLVSLQIHGSSISVVSQIIHPNILLSENERPIMGVARSVQGDEFNVSTLLALSQEFTNYSSANWIAGASNTNMLTVYNQPVRDITALAKPFFWGFLLLGSSVGLSWYWIGRLFGLFFVTFELFRILTKDKRYLAVVAAFLITFAPIVQWRFAVNFLVEMLIAGQLAVIITYIYLNTEDVRKKFLCSFVLALCACAYVFALYPPWMIPLAYLFIALFIAIVIENFQNTSKTRTDIFCIIFTMLVFISIISYWLYVSWDAIYAVLNSDYPAQQFYRGGNGFVFLTYYTTNLITIFDTYVPVGSASAFGFFPLTFFFAIIYLAKYKFQDKMIVYLMIVNTIFITYIIFGFPDFLAKYSLLSNVENIRLAPMIMIIDIYILFRIISKVQYPFISEKGSRIAFMLVCGYLSAFTIWITWRDANEYFIPRMGLPVFYLVFFWCIMMLIALFIIVNKTHLIKNLFAIGLVSMALISGGLVNPVMQTVDAVRERPLSLAVQKINTENPGVWIANTPFISNFLIANGAPTISSTQIIPNTAKWEIVDSTGDYRYIYNRYAHIFVRIVNEESSFELTHTDGFLLNLGVKDMYSLRIKYLALDPTAVLPSAEWDGSFELVFYADHIRIYRVNY